jgi:hypothetical protein
MGYLLAYTPYTTNLFLRGRNSINPLVSAFIARVAADGGTFEAQSCLVSQLTALNNIS